MGSLLPARWSAASSQPWSLPQLARILKVLADETPELPVAEEPIRHAMVEIFDPPMCCSTGLCGPILEQTLLDASETILALQAKGMRVECHQMTSHPNAFLGNAEVMRLVREQQMVPCPLRSSVVASSRLAPLLGLYSTFLQRRRPATKTTNIDDLILAAIGNETQT